MRKYSIALATALALALPATAGAHITLQPKEAAAGGFTKLDVRVPNEKDNASTTKVDLQLPPGFVFASYAPAPGWTAKVIKRKLAKPVQTDDGEIANEVRRIVWSGGKIGPGQFVDFPLSVQIPDKAGRKLTFKALQTYSDGEVVRWIGPPDSERPAPQVAVTAAQAEHGAAKDEKADDNGSDDDDSDGASKGLGIAALILGGVGVLLGGAAFLRGGRKG
jgi:uncharacterized protein